MNRQDMRTLGRIGQPLSGGTYRRRRRRLRAPRWLVAILVAAVAGLLWLGVAANRQVEAVQPGRAVAADLRPRPAMIDRASRSNQRTAAADVFASVEQLNLVVPHAAPHAIAFHEASEAEALALEPVGTLLANDNATRFSPPPDTDGPPYRVLSSRGRARPPTSAVDIVVSVGDAVASPVSGTVKEVTEYPLYGRIRDWRVEITPEGRPDLTVVVIHLLRPSVEVGEKVDAGVTPMGVVRLLPFESHVDYVTSDQQPHAHIEVKPSVDDGPIDPNAPALPAGAGDEAAS